MGKTLIIKGADFSENRLKKITWYVDELNWAVSNKLVGNLTSSQPDFSGFSPIYDFGGKTLNIVQFYAKESGNLSLCIADSLKDTEYEVVRQITINSGELGTIVTKRFDDIEVPSGKILFINIPTDTGKFGFVANTSPLMVSGFHYQVGRSDAYNTTTHELLTINWGYEN